MAIKPIEQTVTRTPMSDEAKANLLLNRKSVDLQYKITGKDETKATPSFVVSTKIQRSLGIDGEKGLFGLYDDDMDGSGNQDATNKAVYLAVVPESSAHFFKSRAKKDGVRLNKGRSFSSTDVTKQLQAAGLLPEELKYQDKHNFKLVATSLEGYPTAYKIEAADGDEEDDEEEGEQGEVEATGTEEASAPKAKKGKAVEEAAQLEY